MRRMWPSSRIGHGKVDRSDALPLDAAAHPLLELGEDRERAGRVVEDRAPARFLHEPRDPREVAAQPGERHPGEPARAPKAGAFASITSGRMPASARRSAAEAPSIPAPTTTTSAPDGSSAAGSGTKGTGSGGGSKRRAGTRLAMVARECTLGGVAHPIELAFRAGEVTLSRRAAPPRPAPAPRPGSACRGRSSSVVPAA